jgi:hypothetical protein
MRTELAVVLAAFVLAAAGSGCDLLADGIISSVQTAQSNSRRREADAVSTREGRAEYDVWAERLERERLEADLVGLEREAMYAACKTEVDEARADALARMRLAEQERERFYLCTAAAQPAGATPATLACVFSLASGNVGTVDSCLATASPRCGAEPPPSPTWPEVGLEELAARGMTSPPPCLAAAVRARAQ